MSLFCPPPPPGDGPNGVGLFPTGLPEMFKATKVPNKRHGMNCSDVDTTENIFKARCEFFRKAIIDYNLQDVKFIHIAGTKGKGCFYVLLLLLSCKNLNQAHSSPWYGITCRINLRVHRGCHEFSWITSRYIHFTSPPYSTRTHQNWQ